MDSAASLIKIVHSKLEANINLIDQQLSNEYNQSLCKINQVRFASFKNCLKSNNQLAVCYKNSLKYQINLNFDKEGNQLQTCIDQIILSKQIQNVQNKINKCTDQYKNQVKKIVNAQLSKITLL